VYKVRFKSPKVEKELEAIPDSDYDNVANKILALRIDPRPHRCRKLVDSIYRVRVGLYRIIYYIDDKQRLVTIGKIDRRKESTYRGISQLFE
jgi:mRNA interferase RelE/StbE